MRVFNLRIMWMCICLCLLIGSLTTKLVCAEMTETERLAAWEKMPAPGSYMPTWNEIRKHKAMYDDPTPIMEEWPMQEILPKGMWDLLTYDEEEMKNMWAELIGFRAPDVVGKIAPEVKPGKYTYEDVANNPGLKELLIPYFVEHLIKPAGPPMAGNIPEFEVVPTMQYYYPLPVSKATKENLGKTKLDANGYFENGTWESGIPFPKPSGPNKASQVIYNENIGRTTNFAFGSNLMWQSPIVGFNSKLKVDNEGYATIRRLGLWGREIIPPFGSLDERAKKLGEWDIFQMTHTAPRDLAGQVMLQTRYLDPEKTSLTLLYIPGLRRVRTLSGTDTQDPVGGQDLITDDLNPQYSTKTYRWEFEIVEEREFLFPAPTIDGSEYVSSPDKGVAFKNLKFQRRPMYVVKLTQTDSNYVYSKRYFFIDAETFCVYFTESYDQQDRLYRVELKLFAFHPEAGMLNFYAMPGLARDHIDVHSNITIPYSYPANYKRSEIGVRGNVMGK